MTTALLAVALLASAPSDTAFARIVTGHIARYPAMTVTDLYKLVHQSAFGSEHAAVDSIAAARWLDSEWKSLGDGPLEPLFDTIAPGGALVRVHLRAWRDARGSSDVVLRAFINTGRDYRRDPRRFARYWDTAIDLARRGVIAFDAAELERYGDTMRQRQYPAVSHSPAFRHQYRPAYRVVTPEAVYQARR